MEYESRSFKNALEALTVKDYGDRNFFPQMKTWLRYRKLIPITESQAKLYMQKAFAGDAARVFQQITAEHPMETKDQWWTRIGDKVANKAQISAIRSEYTSLKLEQGESVLSMATRARYLSDALPDDIGEDMHRQRIIDALPVMLQNQANLAGSSADDVVAHCDRYLQKNPSTRHPPGRERHQEIEELGEVREDQRRRPPSGRRPTRETNTWPQKVRDAPEETYPVCTIQGSGQPGSPIGYNMATKPHGFSQVKKCYFCGLTGHIYRLGEQTCEHPRMVRAQEQGQDFRPRAPRDRRG